MAIESLGPPPAVVPPRAPPARLELVPLAAIRVPPERRRARAEVDGLRESIAANGLLQPVVLDDAMTLVCGLHRLEACRELGWLEIPAVVRAWTAAEAHLAEVDENLCRRELTVLERAEHIALRKRLWHELRAARAAAQPANESAPAKGKGKGKAKEGTARSKRAELEELAVFVNDTARRTGRANAAVREEIRIGELGEDVRSVARTTPLCDNRRELLALTRMPAEAQREAVERVRAGEAKSVRPKRPRAPAPSAPPPADPPAEAESAGEASAPRAARAAVDPAALRAWCEALDEAHRAIERALEAWPPGAAGAHEFEGRAALCDAADAVQRLAGRVRDGG